MLDFSEAQRRAGVRFVRTSTRRRRSDAGQSRLDPVVLRTMRSLVLGVDRPAMAQIRRRIDAVCLEHRLRSPSRASLYNTLGKIPGHTYQASRLPPHVCEALYNLAPDAKLPGHQLVFYCFNYGSLAAVSYASGLPWLDLYQASFLRGWRPRSRGLLHAAMRARAIT